MHRIGKRAATLLQELGREATHAEIAEGMDITEEEVAKTMAISQTHLSLDAPMTPGEDNSLIDHLADTNRLLPDEKRSRRRSSRPFTSRCAFSSSAKLACCACTSVSTATSR